MHDTIDLERLAQVFTDHPWLAEAISNGAWWGNADGTIRFVPPLEDPSEVRRGLAAFADALGCARFDVGLAVPQVPGIESTPTGVRVRRAAD